MKATNNINITATESLCPHCLTRIPAERRLEGDDLFLVKSCPEHGEFRTPVWRGEPHLSGWSRPKKPVQSGTHHPAEASGCPFDCGICSKHRQQSCTVLIEVTGRCNLACPFCFAAAGTQTAADPSLSTIEKWYRTALEKSGPHNIVQLSGGEATLRDDLPAIIALGRDLGFPIYPAEQQRRAPCRRSGLCRRVETGRALLRIPPVRRHRRPDLSDDPGARPARRETEGHKSLCRRRARSGAGADHRAGGQHR